jgi:hypothetical protein
MSSFPVEIRTWPERTDLLVIDVQGAVLLAHYELDQKRDDPLFNPLAPYQQRASAAVAALHSDQDYLRAYFNTKTDVQLEVDPSSRERIAELLHEYQLTLETVSLEQYHQLVEHLQSMSVDSLFDLLVDWHDVVERHYPPGASKLDPGSWAHRAAPDQQYSFHYLTCGIESRAGANSEQSRAAYKFFRDLIDVGLADFTLGQLVRWVYYHRTEFKDQQRFELRALQELE